jgi:hypothetical protein
LKEPSTLFRLGNNLTAFRGGFRLGNLDDIPTHTGMNDEPARAERHHHWCVV